MTHDYKCNGTTVKAGRKVAQLRRSKSVPPGSVLDLERGATVVAEVEPVGRGRRGDGRFKSCLPPGSGEVGGAGGAGVEVFAFEAVAVAFEADDL
jgi:hypothetical protein